VAGGAVEVKGMEYEGLCQDCLRVSMVEVSSAWTGEGGCVCGGDMCVCGFCQGDIGRLRAGVRSGKLLHTVCDIRSWSSEDGMVTAEESA